MDKDNFMNFAGIGAQASQPMHVPGNILMNTHSVMKSSYNSPTRSLIAKGFCVSNTVGDQTSKISGPYILIIPETLDEVMVIGRNAVSSSTTILNKTLDSLEYNFESKHKTYGTSSGNATIKSINISSDFLNIDRVIEINYTNDYDNGSKRKGIMYFYDPNIFMHMQHGSIEFESFNRTWSDIVGRSSLNILG